MTPDPQLAFVFPGQGSQAIGMLAELAAVHPQVRETFEEAGQGAGIDLWSLSQEGPEDQLNRTEFTQPALLAAGVAAWRAWQARGGAMPSVLAGHSLGEYAALVAAGALLVEEDVEGDARPSHPEHPPTGPPFTSDDLLELYEACAEPEWLDRLITPVDSARSEGPR